MSEIPTPKTHPELFVKQGKTSRSEVPPFFKLLPWWAVFISTVVVLLAEVLVITARAVTRLPKFMVDVWREAQSLESVSEYRDRRQAVRERMANLTPDSPESDKAIYERFKDEIEAYKRKRDKGRT